jgi:ferredoxin-NADP reductase
MLRRAELQVVDLWNETHDTRTFRLGAPPGGLPDFRPGQFYAVEVQAPDGSWVRRSYSIASAPAQREFFDLTIKFLEGGTATGVWFRDIKKGSRVRATGPFGEFILDESRPAIFVAGGVGVTPLMSMLRHIDAQSLALPVLLLYSNRTSADVIYERELRELRTRRPNISIHFSLTREPAGTAWTDRRGRFDASALRELCGSMTDRNVYLCGTMEMMESAGRAFVAMGFPGSQLRTEAFLGTSPTF